MTKQRQLLDWIRAQGVVRTHEVIAWGLAHYSNRADRDARALAAKGLIRRLSDFEKETRFGKVKEDAWTATGDNWRRDKQMSFLDAVEA
jgi:hypothetical protein